jgi:hypothetical protein
MGCFGGRYELVVDVVEYALWRVGSGVQGLAMEGGAEANGREGPYVYLLQQYFPQLCLFVGNTSCG